MKKKVNMILISLYLVIAVGLSAYIGYQPKQLPKQPLEQNLR